MASNLIQIKRSQTTATPTSLANGELAFTAAGNVVFIGNYGTVLPIGGQRNPGILTANQALVANSTSFINQVKVADLTVSGSLSANGSLGNQDDVLITDGSSKAYWVPVSSLIPGYIANTDSRTLSGNLYFSAANTYIENLNVGTINRSPKLTLTGDVSGNVTFTNLGDAILNVTVGNANGVTLGVDTEGDYVADVYAANGINVSGGTGATSAAYISIKAADGITSNSTGLFANVDNSSLELSGGAIRVKDNGIALGTKTTGDYVANVVAGNGISISSGSGEGSTPTISIPVHEGLIANATGLYVNSAYFGGIGTSDVSFTNLQVYGNTILGTTSSQTITINSTLTGNLVPTSDDTYTVGAQGSVWNNGYFTQLQLGSTSDTTITASGNTIQVYGLTVNSNFIANTATIYHDLYLGGDLHITGNAVFANVESYIVTDPLIQLAANNTNTDLLDIGFFGNYNQGGGAHEHTGLFRDASDGVYKLFDGLQVAPTTFVDTANNTYHQATLQAYLNSGALVSNATNLNITATNNLAVALIANTLTLSTALAATSGGTGYNNYTIGDLLTADSSSTLTRLAIGPVGSILQSNGTALVYETMDGGTF